LTRLLLERSAVNKEANDASRLDNFYQRRWRINELLGAEVLPEPRCDPRDPEFKNAPGCALNGGLLPPSALR